MEEPIPDYVQEQLEEYWGEQAAKEAEKRRKELEAQGSLQSTGAQGGDSSASAQS